MINNVAITHYFEKGLHLAKQSTPIFAMKVALSLLGLFAGRIGLLSIVFLLIDTSITVSIPSLLLDRQRGVAFDFKKITQTLLKNGKRIIVPLIVFIIIGIIVLVPANLLLSAQGNSLLSFPVDIPTIIFIAVFGFLQFTTIYFSIEEEGLFASMKLSVKTARKHMTFIGAIIAVNIVLYLLWKLLSISTPLMQSVQTLIGGYVSFVLSAATLIYYQEKVKR